MKIILGIFCALVVLFAGGCALILLSELMYGGGSETVALALIPAAVAALNILVLIPLFGSSPPRRWAFYLLAGVDVMAALGIGAVWGAMASQMPDTAVIAIPVIGLLLLKAFLTVRFLQAAPPPQ
jgi:quinol-cytochrome oxidoreductase complex cytochrome b subunit